MHKPQSFLVDKLKKASVQVQVGGSYYHYKNPDHTYVVLNLAVMEADEEPCVIYQAQYGDRLIFVRPLKSWLDKIELENQTVSRFTLL